MRQAVVRIDVDPDRTLSPGDIAAGIGRLGGSGVTVNRHPGERTVELVIDSDTPDQARARAFEACTAAFGTAPALGTITFISRGTDQDALGVVEAFGVQAHLERTEEDGEEVAVFTLPAADRRRVPESRLHTALEAALNCEVRIVFA
jgi:hypothetical protein